jgi:hypothetical protein
VDAIDRLSDADVVGLYMVGWPDCTQPVTESPDGFLIKRVKKQYGCTDEEAIEHIRAVRQELKDRGKVRRQ